MNLPPEIRRRTEADEVIWELPARPLGKLRGVGWAMVLLSGIIPVVFVATGLGAGMSGDLPESARLVVFFLMLPLFLLPDALLLGLGCLLLFGRVRIEWRRDGLRPREVLGPLGWSRRLPPHPPERITVRRGRVRVNGRPVSDGPLSDIAALTLRYPEGTRRLLVWGYPARWLEPLAEELRERFGQHTETPPEVVKSVPLPDAAEPDDREVWEQPPGSTVRMEQRSDRLQLVIPPAGLRKGSKGLFTFALIWCGFMGVVAAFILLAGGAGAFPWFAWLILLLLGGVGLALLAGAVNMGRRRAVIIADAHGLRIAREDLFGRRSWRWRWEEIAAIRVAPSGMEVNNVPILELKIHPRAGDATGLFSERDDDELRWMATVLRQWQRPPRAAS